MHFFAYEYDQVQHRLRQRASLAFSEVTFYALQIFGGMGILSVSMWFRLDMVGPEERQHEQEDFLSADSWIPVQPVQKISFLFVNH